ncbi:MAG: ureidoglycolate lyase [Rhizobacter sp.]
MASALPLSPVALTAEAFAPFGDVIEASEAALHYPINQGNTERFHDLAQVDPGVGGRLVVSIFRAAPREMPFTVGVMERHPRGSQAFMPLFGGGAGNPSARTYLVVVAPRGPAPTARQLRCFVAQAHQGVNYAAGVWHHPLLALHETSDFLVLDREGPGDNCDEVTLDPPATIDLSDRI